MNQSEGKLACIAYSLLLEAHGYLSGTILHSACYIINVISYYHCCHRGDMAG